MIDDITIDFLYSRNFCKHEGYLLKSKKSNGRFLSKFTSNKKILSGVVVLNYN